MARNNNHNHDDGSEEITIEYGGKMLKAKYDPKTSKAYIMDENGDLDGRWFYLDPNQDGKAIKTTNKNPNNSFEPVVLTEDIVLPPSDNAEAKDEDSKKEDTPATGKNGDVLKKLKLFGKKEEKSNADVSNGQEASRDASKLPEGTSPPAASGCNNNDSADEQGDTDPVAEQRIEAADIEEDSCSEPAPNEDADAVSANDSGETTDETAPGASDFHVEVPEKSVLKKHPQFTVSGNQKKTIAIIAGCCVVVIVVVIAAVSGGKFGKDRDDDALSSTESVSTVLGDYPQEKPTKQTEVFDDSSIAEGGMTEAAVVSILTTTTDIYPGTQITEDMIQKTQILLSDFRNANLSSGLYTLEELPGIVGMYADQFIPANCYLTYENIATEFVRVNPWDAELSGGYILDIPMSITAENISKFIFGCSLDLKITATTQADTTKDEESEAVSGDGIQQEDSEAMKILTYSVTGVRVVDLLNMDGASLFGTYMAFGDVPAVHLQDALLHRYSSNVAAAEEMPVMIRVRITEDQHKILGNLSWDNATIELINSVPVADNELQLNTAQTMEKILPNIMKSIENALQNQEG